MIVELLIDLLVWLVGLVFDLIPDIPVPGFVDDLGGYVSTLAGYVSGLGAWVPIALGLQVAAAVVAARVAGLAIKLIRFLLSLFTGGGGSSA